LRSRITTLCNAPLVFFSGSRRDLFLTRALDAGVERTFAGAADPSGVISEPFDFVLARPSQRLSATGSRSISIR
jgi:hypothetical protein